MKLITKINIVEVDEDFVERRLYDLQRFDRSGQVSPSIADNLHTEIIKGRRFHRCVLRKGRLGQPVTQELYNLVIGATADVGNVLGIYMEDFDKMAEDNEQKLQKILELDYKVKNLEKKVKSFESIGFWGKVRRLFKECL
jgi:hypothetical protein